MKWILIIFLSTVQSSLRSFQITFPEEEKLSYAKFYGTIDRPLKDFTLCHWSRLNVNVENWACPFSYYTSNKTGEFNSISTCIKNNGVVFRRAGEYTHLVVNIEITEWIHKCITWTYVKNTWQIFINGKRIGQGNWSHQNPPLQSNGVVILGQLQSSIEGSFVSAHKFTGQMSEVHLWDYILTPNEILQVSNCKHTKQGNVIAWNHATWALYNGSRISPVYLPCGDPQY